MTVAKYICFMINHYNLWGSNARSGPSEINVSTSKALYVFFWVFFLLLFFFVTMIVDLQIKASKIAEAPFKYPGAPLSTRVQGKK